MNVTHQQALATAISGDSATTQFNARGIQAYRRNLRAKAYRALATTYRTVDLLLGSRPMAVLARLFLEEKGRTEFDWGAWGSDFPIWLASQPVCERHPYLPDIAQLDLAVHICDRAANSQINFESMQLLDTEDSYTTCFSFSPGASLIQSDFPIVDIYSAHRKSATNPDLASSRYKLRMGIGQTALIWRKNWQTHVIEPQRNELVWLRLLKNSGSIGTTLDSASDQTEALDVFLTRAIRDQLVCGLATCTT